MFRQGSRRLFVATQSLFRKEGKMSATMITKEWSSSSRSSASSSSTTSSTAAAFLCVALGAIAAGSCVNYAENAGVDVKRVKADIIAAVEKDEEKREDGTSIGPTLIRLAWHAAGTYSIFDKTGGSNYATMRFAPEAEWGANAGLKIARDFLEPIRKKHGLSHGDVWTLAGATAVESMGGPAIRWRPGRTDVSQTAQKVLPNGRLPGADAGCPHATNAHIRDIFGRMGFNDREIVALLGAHAVGRCHTENSGYWGPWTNAETTFSNQYFVLLVNEKWIPKKTHLGKAWTGPLQFESARDSQIMMLPADLWLLQDPSFTKIAKEFAADEALFFREFANAFSKLLELGVTFP